MRQWADTSRQSLPGDAARACAWKGPQSVQSEALSGMRNDADYHVRSPRGGKFSSLPSSFRTISNYLRSVSANASSIAASTVRQAAVSAASSVSLNHEDDRQREQVQWSNFDKLELRSGEIRRVLLLTYSNGFQVWDVQDASNVHELVSRRDGPVAFLRLAPKPITADPVDGGSSFKGAHPLLLVVTSDTSGSGSPRGGGFPGGYGGGSGGGNAGVSGSHFVPTVVKFYSLRTHSYVHTLRFRTGIHAVRCSSRVIAVALATQIYCFDAGSLQNIFSVLTYPSATPSPGSSHYGFGAMAVGPRWLAYAANQPLVATTGRVAPQHLTPSPGVSPSSSPANGSFVAHYAKESSKHLVAGVVTLGDMVYKTTKSYYSELMPDGGNGSPGVGSPNWKNGSNGHSPWQGGSVPEPEFAGTVIIRDIVSKSVVAQFRAHTSPLSAVSFDPSGTLLVTASVYGHNLNVFRLTPPSSSPGGPGVGDSSVTHVHLYKLSRGVTNAVIQDISFSADSHWIAVSSSRGTNHLFAISPFGGPVGPQTHGTVPVDGLIGPTLTSSPVFPWWSSPGSLSSSPQALHPPPSAITLNVVSRVKNGTGGWRGTVTSAAVTATGRPHVLAGAVAAVFHDGGGAGVESGVGVGTLKDQLWVMCPTGHLLRYLLRPSAGGDGGYPNGLPQMAGMGSPGSPGLAQELKVVVEPVERWDVARRPNWVEREERVESEGAGDEVAGVGVSAIPCVCPGSVAKDGMTTEELQRWFMSNAEVQMHQARPVPIWAKSKIQFHLMLTGPGASSESDGDVSGDDGFGEMEIERIPTRIVEVRRKDLVPVIERLEKFKKVQGSREVLVPDPLPGVSNAHEQLLGDEGLQEGSGRWVAGVRGLPIRRTSSCSSFGSEGAPLAGSGGGVNGYHRGYQDSVGADTPPSSFGSPPYFHQQQPQPGSAAPVTGRDAGPLLRSKSGGFELYQENFHALVDPVVGAMGSPINIPRVEARDMFRNSTQAGVSAASGFPNSGGSGSGDHDGGSAGAGSSDGQMDPSLPQLRTPGSDVSLSRDLHGLALHDSIAKRSGFPFPAKAKSRWSLMPSGQLLANGSVKPSSGTPPAPSDSKPECEGAFLVDDCGHRGSGGVVIDSPVDSSPGDGVVGGPGEDGESEDTEGGRSKSEENEPAERGEDVWEGSMFPFCEEDC